MAAFPGPSRPSDLRSVWDAIRYSCEEINDDGRGDRLARVLVKIEERLTDQVVIGNLRAWREQTLPKPAEETEQSASIFVRVDPLREDKAYQVTLSAYIDGIAERAAGTVKATGNTLRAQVQHEMPAMLERMGDRDPIIEFALPRDFLLKKRVGEWHTGTFGIPINSYQVIVRDVARLNPAYGDLRSQWRLRSKKLRTPPWPSPDVIECKSKPAGISKMLLDPKIFSVVLVSVPTLAQLNAILNAGIPVVFWPSEQSCNGGDHSHCQPRELAEGLREKVGTADFDKLPVLVKDLRHGRGTDHSMELTLLWDDPGRIPPDPPMFTDGDHV